MKKLVFVLFSIIVANNSFAQENFAIKANIANRNGDVLFVKNNNIIVKEIKVDGSGYFTSTFDIKEGMYQLYDGKEYTDVFLKNGFDLFLNMDAKKFDESIIYSGKGSEENNYLAKKFS
jgi:hypothetical protein